MTPLTLAVILEGLNADLSGDLSRDTRISKIERDSRQVTPGDLFIAIEGEQFDGHAFVERAAELGAVGAVVRREWAVQTNAAANNALPPLLLVDDTMAALQRLAAERRARRGDSLTVIGVTGSIGKTSTKEVIASVLSQRFETYRSPGNLNNEIGLPLSLLDVKPGHQAAVLEMGGAYALGELTLLAGIARPQVGVVTNVYPVHLERMGTIEAIAETKTELIAALPADGVAVLNGDDPRVRAMAERTRARVITYGLGQDNHVRADNVITEGLSGTSFRLFLNGERFQINKLPLLGGHAVHLALAAIAVGHGLGLHISDMLPGFEDPTIQVRLLIMPGPNGSRLIDDTYNASTPSMLSALGLLEELRPNRAIAVLGEMRELGELAIEEHRIVGRRAGQVADLIVTYGDLARIIAEEAAALTPDDVSGTPPSVRSFDLDERNALLTYLKRELREGDIVLLKGSRGLKMEELVTALRPDTGGLADHEPTIESDEVPSA